MLNTVSSVMETKSFAPVETAIDAYDAAVMAFLRQGQALRGINDAELARRSGLSKATVSRLMKRGRGGKGRAPFEQILVLAKAFQMPVPQELLPPGVEPSGFAEPDVVQLEGLKTGLSDPNITLWQLRADHLAGAGYLPGDELFFDARIAPVRGDIVLANVYKRAGAETVIRIWMPPFLVAAEIGRTTIAPVEVREEDDPKAVILGTMIDLRRRRRSDAA